MKHSFKEWSRRALAALLAVAMALGMVPATALADDISSGLTINLGEKVSLKKDTHIYLSNNQDNSSFGESKKIDDKDKGEYTLNLGTQDEANPQNHIFTLTKGGTTITLTIVDSTETDVSKIKGIKVYANPETQGPENKQGERKKPLQVPSLLGWP